MDTLLTPQPVGPLSRRSLLRQALKLTAQPPRVRASASQESLLLSQPVMGVVSSPAPGTLLVRHQMSFVKKPALPYGLEWEPDSGLLAALAIPSPVRDLPRERLLYLWEAAGAIYAVYQPFPGDARWAALAWGPDSQHLSSLEGSRQVMEVSLVMWNVTTGLIDERLGIAAGVENYTSFPVYALAWSPDRKRIAMAADGGTVAWEVVSGDLSSKGLRTSYPTDVSYIVAWSPDSKTIASAGRTHAVQFWEAASGRPLHYFPEETKALAAAWSPDGQALAYLAGPVSLQTWNRPQSLTLVVREVNSGRLLLSQPAVYPALPSGLPGIPLLLRSLAWSPTSRWLAVAGQGATVQVWEIARQRLALTYRGHRAPVLAVAWSPRGDWLASASSDGDVHVWKAP
ncbi:WD40 repeat domain-containing protein [Thermogemmatispora sp.]|uniref:WD40 repeat domain-containing protein n=1 Tax=Thermogemmatispora sp. TaxID=1968838 RepID=UPI001D911364|nr:hypothetical protein [Thermogemmatispora sp.]MBX5450131.1 PD40 domain-containing protein [Thermogemmatispora sp.]